MQEPLPFDTTTITESLERLDLVFETNEHTTMLWMHDDDDAPLLSLRLMAGGSSECRCFDLVAVFPESYDCNGWPLLHRLTNDWNLRYRFPMALVRFDSTSPRAFITAEQHVSVRKGMHDELVDETIMSMIVRSLGLRSFLEHNGAMDPQAVDSQGLFEADADDTLREALQEILNGLRPRDEAA